MKFIENKEKLVAYENIADLTQRPEANLVWRGKRDKLIHRGKMPVVRTHIFCWCLNLKYLCIHRLRLPKILMSDER